MKGILPPMALLAGLLAFSLWNSSQITRDTARWRAQLQQADTLSQAGNWPEAVSTLVHYIQV